MKTHYKTIKRLLDVIISSCGIVVTSPLMLLIALTIKGSSEGPVFFKQERMGYKGKPFNIIKFRTMVVNAEKMGTGVFIKGKNEASDNRITTVGRVLRKTSMDELPQLFNVLKGDMSLVGPRPPVLYHPYDGYDNYPEWAKKRFDVRPGITGMVQVSMRSKAEWEDRIKIDVEYTEKESFLLDLEIMLKTIGTIFRQY